MRKQGLGRGGRSVESVQYNQVGLSSTYQHSVLAPILTSEGLVYSS